MELFTYLMAKNDHNTSVKKDLFSYLLGKNQSGTYTDYSGTSLSINNTKKGKMKLSLKGNTSQDSTTGKQLWQGNKDYTGQGTVAQIHQTLTPGTYTVSYKQSVNGTVQFNLKDSGGTVVQAVTTYAVAGNSLATFEVTSNAITDIWLYLSVSMTVTDIMINDDSTALPYEEYTGGIASPNPSYPQRVKVVSGDNEVVVCGKNLFDNGNYTFDYNYGTATYSDGVYTFVPASTSSSARIQFIIPKTNFIENQQYTFSANGINKISVGYASSVSDNSHFSYFVNENNSSATFTYTSIPTDYVCVWFWNTNSTLGTNWVLSNIMLNTGSTAQPYEPHQSSTYPINLPVENMVGELVESSRAWTNGEIVANSNYDRTDYIPVIPNTSYYVQHTAGNDVAFVGWWYDANKTPITPNIAIAGSYDVSGVITSPSNAKYVIINFFKNTISTNTPTLTKGNTIPIISDNPIELNNISTYEDGFFKAITGDDVYDNLDSATKETLDYGEWYLEEKIGEITFNGLENWGSVGSYQRYVTTISDFTSPSESSIASILCDKLKATTKNNIYSVDNAISGGDINTHQMFVRINDTITSVELLKTFLSNNPLLVYYQLSTPTYTKIEGTLAEQLEAVWRAYSYKGQTNINQVNNDLPFELDVSVKVSA